MKTTVYIAMSLDGFIASEDGSVDFLTPYQEQQGDDDDDDMGFGDFLKSIDVIIMGRNTFDTVVSFGKDMWPYGKKPIYVWTRNTDAVEIPDFRQESVSASSLDPVRLVEHLEKQNYQNAYVDGGTTIQNFLAANLIDKFILTRVPLLLGKGIPLFAALDTSIPLRHLETTSFPNGLVMSKYDKN